MKFYTYFSQEPAPFSGPYTGGSVVVTADRDWTISRENPLAVPEWGLYDAIEGAPAPGNPFYYTLRDGRPVLRFEGIEGAASGRVRETNIWDEIPIDDLLALKIREADDELARVMSTNFRSTDRPNWVGLLTPGQKEWLFIVCCALQDRLERGVSYYPRNVPVAGLNTVNGNREVIALDRAQWTSYWDDLGKHGFDAVDAWGLVINDAEAQHAAGNWSALAAIDVAAPEYGWPETWNGAAFV